MGASLRLAGRKGRLGWFSSRASQFLVKVPASWFSGFRAPLQKRGVARVKQTHILAMVFGGERVFGVPEPRLVFRKLVGREA